MAVKVETFEDKMFTFFNFTVIIAVTDIVHKDFKLLSFNISDI